MNPSSWPLEHGFDTWLGTNVSHDYANAQLIQSVQDGKTPIAGYEMLKDRLRSDTKTTDSLTKLYTNATIDFIRANRSQPFLAYGPT